MSLEAVMQFLQKAGEDESLQNELATAMQAEDDRAAVTQVGNQRGYEFTSDELWAEVQKRQAAVQASNELSEDELEAVAGGTLTNLLTPGLCVSVAGLSGWRPGPSISHPVKW